MELFKIWSTFNLKGDAFVKMEKFSASTKTASKQVNELNKLINVLSTRLTSIQKKLSTINPHLSTFSTTMIRMTTNSRMGREAIDGLNRSFTNSANRVQTMSRNTEKLSLNLAQVAQKSILAAESLNGVRAAGLGAMRIGMGGGGRRGIGGHGRYPAGHLGALGLAAMVEPTGLLMSASMFGAPVAAVAAGGFMVHQGYEKEKEFQRSMVQLRAQGLNSTQLQEAEKTARRNISPGISPLSNIQAFVDAMLVTADPKSASTLAPALARAKVGAQVSFGGMSEKQTQDLIRFAELFGANDVEKVRTWMDAGVKMMSVSGGTLMPTEQRTFARMVAGAGGRLTPEAVFSLEPIFQSLGGARTGTGLTTGINAFIARTGTLNNKQRVQHLSSLGLLTAQYDSDGRPLGVKMPQEYKNTLTTEPFKFLTDIYLPKLKKSGVTKEEDIHEAMILDFPTTMARDMYEMMRNTEKILILRSKYENVAGTNSLFGMAMKTPEGAHERLSKAWESMASAFGTLTTPAVVSGMNKLASFLESMATLFNYFNGTLDATQKNSMVTGQSNAAKAAFGNGLVGSVNTGLENFSRRAFFTSPSEYYNSSNFFKIPSKSTGAMSSIPTNSTSSSDKVNVILNIDSKAIAKAILPGMSHIMSAGGVVSGTKYTNISLTPISTNYINVGGQ